MFDVMVGTPAIRNLARDSEMHQARSVMETSGSSGMQTTYNAVLTLLADGLVGYEQAGRFTCPL